ncbi:MAG: plasmid recombination protein [Clostridia bacterium]|nr:plasmid recombination protein [Clostridia bacterium]
MEQELAYSFHLGSDKNKSKIAKKTAKGNVSGTTSLSNNAIQNANDLSRVNKHNLRDYDNQRDLITTIYGTNDIVEDVKQVYLDEFEQARIEYNSKTRADRQVKDYFQKVCNSQNDSACEIIIELGDMDFWLDKDDEYRFKMTDVYNEQIQDLTKILPTFKIANATIHYDETSPHMHVIGIPVIDNCKRGMKKQVGKSQLFTKIILAEIQDKMRNACIKSYNKFYDVDSRLKTKQKGRNQDINVKEMGNYREFKRKLEQERKKLENANKQTKKIDNSSKDIVELLNSLKPMPFSKNNSQISNENIENIKDYIKDVIDVTKTVRSVNDLNLSIKEFEHASFEVEKENKSLKYQIELKDEEIKGLKKDLSAKEKIITKLREEKESLKAQLKKFKGFWHSLMSHFHKRITYDNDQNYKIVSDDIYKNGIFDDNDNEIANNIYRKVTIPTENKNNKLKKKNDFNLN